MLDSSLTAEQVSELYEKGRCGTLDPALRHNLVLAWEDFLDAPRNGEVAVQRGTCSQWELVRGMVDEELLEHLLKDHPF